MITPLVRILAFTRALPLILCAAGPATTQTLAPDDPAVLLGYFSLEHAIEQAAAKDPSLRESAASMMGISESEFAVVARIADSVLADVQNITTEASLHPTNPAAERQFETRRRAVLLAGLNTLHQQLSPDGWTALHGYINGRYRANLRFRRVAAQ
jgi:hypothetical protein